MPNTTNYNLRKSEVVRDLKRMGDSPLSDGYRINAVYSFTNQKWILLGARCYINAKGAKNLSYIYNKYAFFSLTIEQRSCIEIVDAIHNGGIKIHPEFPTIHSAEGANWRNSLLPSIVSKNAPLRILTIVAEKEAHFEETKLVGYKLPFYPSAQEYIKEFLCMEEYHGTQDGRNGEFFLEAREQRGRIDFRNGRVMIFQNNVDLCLVGSKPSSSSFTVSSNESLELTPQELKDAELWLVTEEDEIIDFISASETPFVYDKRSDVDYQSIVLRGESENCEFKKYVALGAKKDGKAYELLQAACALSNSNGGNIFIGVSDDAEFLGIEQDVKKDYRVALESALEFYIEDVKRLLREGLRYNQCFDSQNIQIATKNILVISIKKTADINSVNSDRQAYVRRGASSVKMLPDDIRAYIQGKSWNLG